MKMQLLNSPSDANQDNDMPAMGQSNLFQNSQSNLSQNSCAKEHQIMQNAIMQSIQNKNFGNLPSPLPAGVAVFSYVNTGVYHNPCGSGLVFWNVSVIGGVQHGHGELWGDDNTVTTVWDY